MNKNVVFHYNVRTGRRITATYAAKVDSCAVIISADDLKVMAVNDAEVEVQTTRLQKARLFAARIAEGAAAERSKIKKSTAKKAVKKAAKKPAGKKVHVKELVRKTSKNK